MLAVAQHEGMIMDRRHFLRAGMGGGALSLMAARAGATSPFDALAGVEPIRASVDRIFRTTVCLRPFRAAGPRIEVEQVGHKRVEARVVVARDAAQFEHLRRQRREVLGSRGGVRCGGLVERRRDERGWA